MVAIHFTGLAGALAAAEAHGPRIQTASIGIPDTFFLMLLALVVFGPRRLPEIGRQIGKLMYEFRKVSNDFKFQMEEELRASEEAERLRKVQSAFTPPAATPEPEAAPLELAAGSEAAPSIEGEVRAETPRTIQIQPPATGEPIAARRPYRSQPETDMGPETGPELQPESQPEPEMPGHAEQEVEHG